MEAKSAKVSIPVVEDCLCCLAPSAGGVVVAVMIIGCKGPFVGGEGSGNRACDPPLDAAPPFEGEESEGV